MILVFLKFCTNIFDCLLFVEIFPVLKIWLTDVSHVSVCQAVLKRLCTIFYPFLIQIISIERLLNHYWDMICLRFPEAKDMFRICLIFGYSQPHDFSLSCFLKQMQNWINIKLITILRRYYRAQNWDFYYKRNFFFLCTKFNTTENLYHYSTSWTHNVKLGV